MDRNSHKTPLIFWKALDRIALITLISLILCVTFEFAQLYQIRAINRAIADPKSIVVTNDSPAEIVFAKAWYLTRNLEIREALRLYNRIEQKGGPDDIAKIQYNMGHIYLTEAARYWNEQGVWAYSEVLTWSTLARKTFHDLLVTDPSNWNARFNLEYALRISPPPRDVEKADWTGHKSSVHSIYPGVPGGGP